MRSCWRCWAAAFWRGGTKKPRRMGGAVCCAPWPRSCALMRPCSGSTRWRWPGATAAAPLFALRAGLCRLGGTLVLMSKFYAPYFFTNVDVSPLQELARGQVVSAVRDVAHKLLDALRTVAEMLADQLANRSGGQYLLFFLLLGVTLVCLIVDGRAGQPVFWKGCAAVTAVIVFLALLLMYRPVEGSRHTLVLDVLLLAALACGGRPPRRGHGSRRAGAGRARRAESGGRLHHAALQRRMGRRGAAN